MIEVSESVGEPADLLDDQVDGFGAAVGDPAGVEVGQHLLPPGLEGAAEPGDLGDRAGGKLAITFSAIRRPWPRWRGRSSGVAGSTARPRSLRVGVAGLQASGELGLLALGQVLDTMAEQPTDLIERIVLVAAVAEGVLLDAAADLVDHLGAEPDHWKASSTATASGSSSRIALA